MNAVLAEDLTQRLPGSIVFPEAGAISTDPDAIVEIDLNRFNPNPSGAIALDAQVLLVPLIKFFRVLRLEEDAADSSYSLHGHTSLIV